jgi:hypothetical protein
MCILEETATKAPTTLRADLKTLHRQLEELDARLQAKKTLAKGAKITGEPAAFSAGR